MRLGRRKDLDGEAGKPRVPEEAFPTRRRLDGLYEVSVSRSAMAIIFSQQWSGSVSRVPLRVTKCNSIPCMTAKNDGGAGVFGGERKLSGSVKGWENWPSDRRQNRVVLAPVAGVKSAEVLVSRTGPDQTIQFADDGDKTNSSPGRARHKPLKPFACREYRDDPVTCGD